jgi:xanthine dehydrogenase YagS FAD-binding subunit
MPATAQSFARAAAAELADAQPRSYNAFKVALAERAIVRALHQALSGVAS